MSEENRELLDLLDNSQKAMGRVDSLLEMLEMSASNQMISSETLLNVVSIMRENIAASVVRMVG